MDRRKRELLEMLPEGASLRMVRRGHYAVELPAGELLRLPDGRPFHLPASPSDHRSLRNARAVIRRLLTYVEVDA